MKKQFLVMAAAASLSASSALADAGQTYVKANAGYAKFNNEKLQTKVGNLALNNKYKAKSGGATFGIGAGYYITDDIRADLMLEHFTNMNHKVDEVTSAGKLVINLKSRATTAMINVYDDFFAIKDVKFFAGLGFGMVNTTGKVDTSLTNASTGAVMGKASDKLKIKSAIAYALHLGATTKVVDNVNVDLAYSWRNLGSVETKLAKGTNFPYRGHHLTLGIRYDI